MNPSATFLVGRPNIGSEVEVSTIEKQRKELQLLIGELKDRDKELNDMVAVHQRQLLSWEEDRQKVLTLEERCSKLEGELHKRTDIIRSLTKKVKSLESNQNECQAALQKTQLQLQEMAQKATHSSLLSEDLEARNENLSNTLVELSAQVGQLQAREQALTTMIKLKDKDIIEAVNHISDCSGKFKLLEHALRDAKMVETCIAKEKQDYKQKLKVLKVEVSKLKDDLNEKTTENNEQREEIIRLKQEKSCLQDELVFSAEREKRKDELLDIAKSKQERTNAELRNLRQIYVKQQSDLQFLNFNVENSQELIQIYDSKMEGPKTLEFRDMCLSDLEIVHPKVDLKRDRNQKPLMKEQKLESVLIQQTQLDKNTCDVCKEKKQFDSTPGGKSVAAVGSLLPTDLAEKPKACCLGGRLQSEPLCAVHAQPLLSPRAGPPGEEKQPWGPLSAEQHWHDVSVYLGLADCSASKQPDRPGGACRDPGEGAGVSGCSLRGACAGAREACEAHCCHPRNIVIEAPGHMSDVEWMSIFKPSKVQRIVRHKSVCTCSGSGVGTKYNNCTRSCFRPGFPFLSGLAPPTLARPSHCHLPHRLSLPHSELTPVPHGLAGGSSQLASRGDEKPGDTEAACDGSSSPKLLPSGLDAATPCGKDDSSPTSKLQRLLAESRQMVSDLELSTLLPVGAERPGSATQKNADISEEPAPKSPFLCD
ncbi:coiled-coil domain-containing protein 62 isoform X2 [Sorex araneus]|uniref:coiled-coil domain-containing protein 62 isoform X2 n=1 Tax=Sorex araneus TaxID=42254 RepID=UPI002433A7C8|nr:coiled-coil domain-containing protein 62 isoform X2 [Sorex araneus]